MGNEITIYTQADKHDWLVTGYRLEDPLKQQPYVTYEGTAYSPDAKFRCAIPYGTRDLGQALSVCDAAADAFVPAPAPEPAEGQEAQAEQTDPYTQTYEVLLHGYNNYAGKVRRWLDYHDRTVEGTSFIYYDPKCAPELKNREQGRCAYVVDSDTAKKGMEEFYFPPATSGYSALLFQGGKRASFV